MVRAHLATFRGPPEVWGGGSRLCFWEQSWRKGTPSSPSLHMCVSPVNTPDSSREAGETPCPLWDPGEIQICPAGRSSSLHPASRSGTCRTRAALVLPPANSSRDPQSPCVPHSQPSSRWPTSLCPWNPSSPVSGKGVPRLVPLFPPGLLCHSGSLGQGVPGQRMGDATGWGP